MGVDTIPTNSFLFVQQKVQLPWFSVNSHTEDMNFAQGGEVGGSNLLREVRDIDPLTKVKGVVVVSIVGRSTVGQFGTLDACAVHCSLYLCSLNVFCIVLCSNSFSSSSMANIMDFL